MVKIYLFFTEDSHLCHTIFLASHQCSCKHQSQGHMIHCFDKYMTLDIFFRSYPMGNLEIQTKRFI